MFQVNCLANILQGTHPSAALNRSLLDALKDQDVCKTTRCETRQSFQTVHQDQKIGLIPPDLPFVQYIVMAPIVDKHYK
jgi:hypothetical protein